MGDAINSINDGIQTDQPDDDMMTHHADHIDVRHDGMAWNLWGKLFQNQRSGGKADQCQKKVYIWMMKAAPLAMGRMRVRKLLLRIQLQLKSLPITNMEAVVMEEVERVLTMMTTGMATTRHSKWSFVPMEQAD